MEGIRAFSCLELSKLEMECIQNCPHISVTKVIFILLLLGLQGSNDNQ